MRVSSSVSDPGRVGSQQDSYVRSATAPADIRNLDVISFSSDANRLLEALAAAEARSAARVQVLAQAGDASQADDWEMAGRIMDTIGGSIYGH